MFAVCHITTYVSEKYSEIQYEFLMNRRNKVDGQAEEQTEEQTARQTN